jgi:hypothetical protein
LRIEWIQRNLFIVEQFIIVELQQFIERIIEQFGQFL